MPYSELIQPSVVGALSGPRLLGAGGAGGAGGRVEEPEPALGRSAAAAAAAAAQAQAQYRATALAAVQNVADVLRAIESADPSASLADQASRAAGQAADLAWRRVNAGDLDRAGALAAEMARHQADLQAAGAQAGRLINAVALYQALGGGWWHGDQPSRKPAPPP